MMTESSEKELSGWKSPDSHSIRAAQNGGAGLCYPLLVYSFTTEF